MWVASERMAERDLPRRILGQFERALNSILGERVLSARSAFAVLVWSAPINLLIWALYFWRTTDSPSSPSSVMINLSGLTSWVLPFAYLHDYLSVCVTRVLLRRAVISRPPYLIIFLVADIFLAYVFLLSAYAIQLSVNLAVYGGNLSFILVGYWEWFAKDLITFSVWIPTQPLTYSALLGAASAMVATWCYLMLFLAGIVARVAGSTAARALEYIEKGRPRRYAICFGILSVVSVVIACILEADSILTKLS